MISLTSNATSVFKTADVPDATTEKLNSFPLTSGKPSSRVALLQENLQKKQLDLDEALSHLLPAHPTVQQRQAEVDYLKDQIAKLTGTDGALWAAWSGAMDRTFHPTFSLRVLRGEQVEEIPVPRPPGEVYELDDEIGHMRLAGKHEPGLRLADVVHGEPEMPVGHDAGRRVDQGLAVDQCHQVADIGVGDRGLDQAHDPSDETGVSALIPVTPRPMISFWIWEVPSYSVVTRASRRYLSTG